MPWTANNNQAGEIRAPAITAALRQKKRLAGDTSLLRTYAQPLRVIALEDIVDNEELTATACSSALLHPDDFPPAPQQQQYVEASDTNTREECIYPRQHAQFVVTVRAHASVPRGHIALSTVQAINLELCNGQLETWSLFHDRVASIHALAIEVRPLVHSATQVVVDAHAFAAAFMHATANRILTENERLVVYFASLHQQPFFVRIVGIDAPDTSETDVTMPDSFRGVVGDAAQTRVFVTADAAAAATTSGLFTLEHADAPDAFDNAVAAALTTRSDIVTVVTSDDEAFPVKKKLLLPCIALASAVLAGHGVHRNAASTIDVAVDCLTFDRVLLYLEHEARGEDTARFEFDPTHTDALLAAATTLQCIGLQDVCRQRLGEFNTRVRRQAIRYDEIKHRNAHGDVWLILGGRMVFDVTRWLPEHPGGSVIIPEQALNVDATVMFEIYHSSRQSFRLLKQFYIGELDEVDVAAVEAASSSEKASPAFVDELKQYTTWRITPDVQTYKSF